MKVHPSHTGESAAARADRASRTADGGAAFASVHKAALELRTGETITQVDGHAYAEIHGGSRDGMYINTSQNSRRGEAFVLSERHGVEYHVYGHGDRRTVVPVKPHAAAGSAAPIALRDGERMDPVSGRPFAEIHGGARDGMYINTGDNERRGRAFAIAYKHGIEYHVYGQGGDRVVVALRHRPDTAVDVSDTAGDTGGTTPTVSARD